MGEIKNKKSPCRKCSSVFRKRTELKDHVKTKHMLKAPVTRAKLSPRSSPKTSNKSLQSSPSTSLQSSPSTSQKKSPSGTKFGSPSRNLKGHVRGVKRLNDENCNE